MGLLVLAFVFLLIGVAGFAVRTKVEVNPEASKYDQDDARNIRLAGLIVGALFVFGAVATVFAASANVVPTREEGVVTVFGHPSGALSNGFHLTNPLAVVHDFNARKQINTYKSSDGAIPKPTDDDFGCVPVRIATQAVPCAVVKVIWRIVPGSAPELYRDYANFDTVRSTLVDTPLRVALNNRFADYNPLATLQAGGTPANLLPSIASQVAADVQAQVKGQVTIISVNIPQVIHDGQTQDQINKFQAAQAQVRITSQLKEVATNQAAANNTLSKSLQQSGSDVLTSKCLDALKYALENSKPWPTNVQCFPSGSGSNVVVPLK
jgi:regulator of protease activity HflC (stomatin/prohibitin superfamily)